MRRSLGKKLVPNQLVEVGDAVVENEGIAD